MFFLEGEQEWKTHEQSGAQFLLDAVTDEEANNLRKEHRLQDGMLNYPAYTAAFCVRAIKDWKHVGAKKNGEILPCTPENVARFGRMHCHSIGAWVTDQATGLHRFIEQEKAEAKKD